MGGVNVQRSIETNSLKKFLYNAACNNHEGSVKRKTVSYKELKGSNSQNIGQGQSVSFKKAVDNDKLYINELRKNTERLKDRVQELGYLINEFYSVIEQKESGIKNEAKFTLEDIKKEISSQIYSCADEIKQLLNNIGAIKDKIEKLEDSFVSLNSEVAELKQLCIDTLDKQNIEFSNVSNLIIELKEICSAIVSDATFFQSINRRGYRFLQNKKNKLFIIIFLALTISILGNIFGIYHFIDKSSDSSNEETTEKIVGNNKSK